MKKRVLSLDLARVLAILGVVAIHTENITASKTNYLGGTSWWLANTIHSLISVSVPLFIMISGALLLHKKNLSKKYVFHKIINQLLPPLLFWWIFFFLWNNRALIFVDFKLIFSEFFYTNIGHLYFLQIIIGLYLVGPLISRSIKNNSAFKPILALSTIAVVVYEYLSFLVLKTYNQTNVLIIFIPFIVYFVWGYYLYKIKLTVRQWSFVAMSSLILTLFISYLTYISTNLFNQGSVLFWTPDGGNLFWEPFTLPVLLLSGMVFVLLNNIEVVFPNMFKSDKTISILVLLSNISFGVYLVHPFILDRLDNVFNLAIHLTELPLWMYYFYRTGLVFTVTSLIVIFMSKFRILNAVLGIRRKENTFR